MNRQIKTEVGNLDTVYPPKVNLCDNMIMTSRRTVFGVKINEDKIQDFGLMIRHPG